MRSEDLETKINAVILLGRQWGMSDSEISRCLAAGSIGDEKTDRQHSSKKAQRRSRDTLCSILTRTVWFIVKWCVLLSFIVVASVIILYYTLSLAAKSSVVMEHHIGKIITPYLYPTMKHARMWLKPALDKWNVAEYYTQECLVANPFYYDPVQNCLLCERTLQFEDLTDKPSVEAKRLIDDVKPFFIKGFHRSRCDFGSLQKLYFENRKRFEQGASSVWTNLPAVYNISDFFHTMAYDDFLKTQKGAAHVTWTSNSVPTSHPIRQMFPRPSFVLPEAEVSLEKRFYIDGPMTRAYELPMSAFANNWYIQAWGRRRLILWPHPDCVKTCIPLEVTLDTGDLLFYQDQYWRLESLPPVTVERDVSIGFSSSFAY